MIVRRFVIVFLSTICGYQQCSDLVAAFVPSQLLRSRMSPLALFAGVEIDTEKNTVDRICRDELIDEAVLLYSAVSQRTRFGDNTESENDILKLRADELTMLIEDSIFDANGIVRGGIILEDSALVAESIKEPETLSEISQALDEQILLGYEATFTEEELEEWIGGIDALQQKLQSALAALPPGSNFATELTAPEPPTPLEQLHGRLETMRTLIDPEGRKRLRLPVAQPVIVSKSKKNDIQVSKNVVKPAPAPNDKSEISEVESVEESKKEKKRPSKLDIENAFIESINKAATSKNAENSEIVLETTEGTTGSKASTEKEISIPEKTITNNDTPSELEFENALIDSMNKVEEDDTPDETDLENALIESMNKAAEDATELELEIALFDPEEDAPSQLELENALIESMNKAAEDEASSELELENSPIKSMNKAAESDSVNDLLSHEAPINQTLTEDSDETELSTVAESKMNTANSTVNGIVEHNETAVEPQEGTDVVSTVATAAALGAAAVTKLPLMLAGVALGPVIRDSIAYAKSRAQKSFDNKTTTEIESKDKTKADKPKAWSAFDPKPHKKATPKATKSKSDSGEKS